MLHLADTRPPIRQNLAIGRISERITGRGLTPLCATLSVQPDAGPVLKLTVRFLTRTEGYFAFNIMPETDLPDLSAAVNVVLRADFQLVGQPPLHAERTVAGTALALTDRPRTVAGQVVTVRTVTGAPIDLSVATDPAPVALRGIVLHDHDPGQPIAGVSVAAGPATGVTDAQGRFFLPALPLLADLVLKLTRNGATTSLPFHIDYDQPVNSATLSLPG